MRARASALVLLAASACVGNMGEDQPTSGPRRPAPPVETTADAGVTDVADATYDAPALRVDASVAPTSYVLTADTVLDGTAHLMWQRMDPPQYFELVPTAYCAGLDLGGFHDWRPATLAELTTLLVPLPTCPLLDHAAFPTALCDWYMSSDTINNDQYNPRMLDFATGISKTDVEVNPNTAYSSRCVRTSP